MPRRDGWYRKDKAMDKVNILGTEYTIIQDNSLLNTDMDGCCKRYDREIRIRNVEHMLEDTDQIEAKETRYNEVLRHEIIHAFFDESGLSDYSDNEQLVQAFRDVGCL